MTDPIALNEDFRDMLEALNHAHVEFLLVGAHALAVHGLPRATGDIDLLVRPTDDNAQRVVAALQMFGAPIEAHGLSAKDFSTQGTVYQLGLPPRRIDLLTEISGVSFDEAWDDRVQASIDGIAVQVIGRRTLLRNKRATARPKDLADAEALEATEESSR